MMDAWQIFLVQQFGKYISCFFFSLQKWKRGRAETCNFFHK